MVDPTAAAPWRAIAALPPALLTHGRPRRSLRCSAAPCADAPIRAEHSWAARRRCPTDEFCGAGSSAWLAPTKTREASPHRRLRQSAYHRLVTTLDTPRLPAIRLTELTDCGGCAAKLCADLLADALSGLGAGRTEPAELIAGLERADDAAAYRISDELAIIGTLDFFPPLVDDARTFGAIAAANALSDVFAMGGRVLFALSIAAFPEELPRDTMAAIFDGAAAKVREAGGTIAGGHTIRDPEPKYGLAGIGGAPPGRLG